MGGGSDVLFPNVTSVEMGENTGGNGEWSELPTCLSAICYLLGGEWGPARMEQSSYGLRLAAGVRHVTGEQALYLYLYFYLCFYLYFYL